MQSDYCLNPFEVREVSKRDLTCLERIAESLNPFEVREVSKRKLFQPLIT